MQHEYGLYGGTDGDEVLEILGGLHVPSVVIAHTILANPTPHQRSVLNDVAALAERVVVMTEAARLRLCDGFDVDASKVTTIAHGAAIPEVRVVPDRVARPLILTWGLIGPGKGIERSIDAMRTLHDLPMRPRYLVAGQTHPKVLAAHGESYRRARVEQAERLGISSSVAFDADYRDVASLTALIQSSKVVVLPYDSKDQVTSGVLVDAIAAGRPVVATAFPHAVELLSSGAGLVVDHDDPDALGRALRKVLTRPELAARMAAEASRLAPSLGWSVVAGKYLDLANCSARRTTRTGVNSLPEGPEPNFAHLVHMTDRPMAPSSTHFLRNPDPSTATAPTTWPACSSLWPGSEAVRRFCAILAMLSLGFLQDALDSQGKCRNRMNRSGIWEDSPALDDCWGRSIWGLGTAASHSEDPLIRHRAARALERAMTQRSPWPRAMAFAALGAAECAQRRSGRRVCAHPSVRCRRLHDQRTGRSAHGPGLSHASPMPTPPSPSR